MIEFQTFVYLPVQKTGTTFISRVLTKFSKETPVRLNSHEPMEADCDRSKFYFISVRDPLDAYISLYSYGSQGEDGRGKMGHKLRKRGLADLYDGSARGFNKWLSHMLQPDNARVLGRHYAKAGRGKIPELVGFQSYRYLRLALPGAEALFDECQSKADILEIHGRNKLATYVIRHETFVTDFCDLIRGPLSHAVTDVEQAVEHIKNTPAINASERIDKHQNVVLEDAVKQVFLEREWFLHEEFGY